MERDRPKEGLLVVRSLYVFVGVLHYISDFARLRTRNSLLTYQSGYNNGSYLHNVLESSYFGSVLGGI